jgi:hypothetical protein
MPLIGTIVTTHYDEIAVVNASNSMTDVEGAMIVDALNILLPTFCSDWNLKPVSAVFVPKGVLSTMPLKCLILESSDAPAVLGYPDETNGIATSKVFVKPILESGGSILNSADSAIPTVAARVSHEIFELIADTNSNIWWNSTSGASLYAGEVCDPVDSNFVNVSVLKFDSTYEEVSLSDWILPAWTDPRAKIGPFNHNNTLTKPFTVDKGGYVMVLQNGRIKYVFGQEVSAHTQRNICSRAQNRVAKNLARCTRPGCDYVKHHNRNIGGGTHCCAVCRFGGGHGPHCTKKQVV